MHFFVFFETTTAFISYLYRKFLNRNNMRKTKLFLLAMITCSIVSCNTQKPETEPKGKDKIGPQELTLT